VGGCYDDYEAIDMSREIKFRAWDKAVREMVCHYDGDFIKWHAPSNWRDFYEVMQFTGLEDCRGVDIYEGDIVSFDIPDSKDGGAVPNCRGTVSIHPGGVAYGTWNYIHGVNVKVIGNIYENPELAEQT
jgi:uncharacterized phage protein (TIGR01671 family)